MRAPRGRPGGRGSVRCRVGSPGIRRRRLRGVGSRCSASGMCGGPVILAADLLAEIGGHDRRSTADLRLAPVHEAGHAAAACEVCPGTLKPVSLRAISDGDGGSAALGVCTNYPAAADVRARLAVMLAGQAAEEVILGVPSAGTGGGPDSDLASATQLATAAVAALVFDDEAGLLWTGLPDATAPPRLLGSVAHPPGPEDDWGSLSVRAQCRGAAPRPRQGAGRCPSHPAGARRGRGRTDHRRATGPHDSRGPGWSVKGRSAQVTGITAEKSITNGSLRYDNLFHERHPSRARKHHQILRQAVRVGRGDGRQHYRGLERGRVIPTVRNPDSHWG